MRSVAATLAAGVGFRPAHHREVLDAERSPWTGFWLELHPQNYFVAGGVCRRWLDGLAERYPLSFHSTGLSLGSADGPDGGQLEQLAALVDAYRPELVSDHLSWSAIGPGAVPDLLPMPYNSEALSCCCDAVDLVQERLNRPMLVENPSRYLGFAGDEFDEVQFLHELCRRTGCALLLDINNVFVSAVNLGLDAEAYLDAVDVDLVAEIHLAGHSSQPQPDGDFLLDDHGAKVCDEVWNLFARFLRRAGPKPSLLEWDTRLPAYEDLLAEARGAQTIIESEGSHVARAA